MKKLLLSILALMLLAALAGGGFWLWRQRPWRTAIAVNGRIITAGELEMRAQTLLNDACRVGTLPADKVHDVAALRHYRRQAAQMWIVKEVLLNEAVARGATVTPADEKESLAQTAMRLKSRNLTPEEFFKEGPLPEALKRRDFREGMLINKFTQKEVGDAIKLTGEEINARMVEQRKRAADEKSATGKTDVQADRKTAINDLRAERFRQGFRGLFRSLYVKADVKCPMFPELETLDGVSPPRPEDAKPVKDEGAGK